MSDDLNPVTKIEQMNQMIRAYCVILLVAVFSGVFVMGAVVALKDPSRSMLVSTESFLLILNTVLIWWFKSRDEQQRRTDMRSTTTTTGGPDGTTVTSSVPGSGA